MVQSKEYDLKESGSTGVSRREFMRDIALSSGGAITFGAWLVAGASLPYGDLQGPAATSVGHPLATVHVAEGGADRSDGATVEVHLPAVDAFQLGADDVGDQVTESIDVHHLAPDLVLREDGNRPLEPNPRGDGGAARGAGQCARRRVVAGTDDRTGSSLSGEGTCRVDTVATGQPERKELVAALREISGHFSRRP